MKAIITHLIVATTMVVLAGNTLSADETVGKQWPASQLASIDQVDHTAFNELLQKYVDTDGGVNYAAWHKDPASRKKLTTYIEMLSCANPQLQNTREAEMAYWINTYNAVTIEGILRVYPTTSIKNHTKVIGQNIWKRLWFQYGGTGRINLESIEHQKLRKMGDARIHFAIVCASIGCPRLLNEAYTSQQLAKQLQVNTQDFFSRSQNLQFDPNRRVLRMSKIMEWYGTDFGPTTNDQIRALASYFPQNVQAQLSQGGYSVGYLGYDWNLNAQKPGSSAAAKGSAAKPAGSATTTTTAPRGSGTTTPRAVPSGSGGR